MTAEQLREIELDIALNAGYFVAQNKIEIEDSRTFISHVVTELAKEFYEKNKLDKGPRDDYMIRVDNFTRRRLFEMYGTTSIKPSQELRIEVDTPKGKIIAGKMPDPKYPGIWVDVVSPTDGAELSATVVEYKPDEEEIMVHVWREEDNGNDPVTTIKWSES
ncbi:hypothetical protein [Aneurinibacillus tyrosinisolvens]|uniref:hypothetical protein n=1 Tax=Aneurinibacillus tyrosinisolvens TaxID=1443435 RepID=UPI00063EDC12|nr:hypothetical protein [Aneurinibacillus tyrosinisolvens]